MRIIFIAILLSLPFSLYGQNCKSSITIGLGSIWPPYYFEKQGKPTGIDIDIMSTIFEQAQLCIHYKKMSTTLRAFVELEKGSIDVLYAASFNAEREKIGLYSKPYRHENVRIFWKKNAVSSLVNGDLYTLLNAGLTGAINAGSYFGPTHDEIINSELMGAISNIPTITSRMKMLAHGRVDFLIEDEITGLYYLQQNKIADIELHPFLVYTNDVSFIFSRKNFTSMQVQEIDDLLQKNSTLISNIIRRYAPSLHR